MVVSLPAPAFKAVVSSSHTLQVRIFGCSDGGWLIQAFDHDQEFVLATARGKDRVWSSLDRASAWVSSELDLKGIEIPVRLPDGSTDEVVG